MSRAYSRDLRERVLRACAVGTETQASIAKRFEVSEATVSEWRKQEREDGRQEAKAHAGGGVMLAGDLPILDAVATEHPGAQLAEYARLVEKRTGRHHSSPALCRALQNDRVVGGGGPLNVRCRRGKPEPFQAFAAACGLGIDRHRENNRRCRYRCLCCLRNHHLPPVSAQAQGALNSG